MKCIDVVNIAGLIVAFLFITIIAGQTTSDRGIILQTIGFLVFIVATAKPWGKYEKYRKTVKIISIWVTVVGLFMQFSTYESVDWSLMIESITG